MKRFIAIILILAAALTLGACRGWCLEEKTAEGGDLCLASVDLDVLAQAATWLMDNFSQPIENFPRKDELFYIKNGAKVDMIRRMDRLFVEVKIKGDNTGTSVYTFSECFK